MTRRLALAMAVAAAFAAPTAHAQIYSNGPLSTGPTATGGQTAPVGYEWSQLQLTNTTLGATCSTSGTTDFRLADDFVVPPGQNWTLTGIDVFAYQTNSPAAPAPFASATLRLWRGAPNAGGVQVCGDTTTDVLAGATEAQLFRVGGTPDQARRIWRLRLNIPAGCAGTGFFTPDTYWVDFKTVSSTAPTQAQFCPVVTVPGQTNVAGANGIQFNGGTGAWVNVVDTGSQTQQALPFELFGQVPVDLQSFQID
jgi:hypothetical protein